MELSEQSIHDVIHPTAAFVNTNNDTYTRKQPDVTTADATWDESALNPKNRIDSLEIPKNPLWQIDGTTAFGSQYYATPLFMGAVAPYRIDLFVPESSTLSRDLRQLLDIDVTFHTRDKHRISSLGITRHLVRIMKYWVSQMDNPRQIYENLPFGSKIVLTNLPLDISKANIKIAQNHALERQLLSATKINEYWGPEIELPPVIDISALVYRSQLHDSVCLVEKDGRPWIFKGLTSFPKYLYHELRQLLKISPHPNIMAKPEFLVTKKCSFGNKTAVVGFLLDYHVHGSLRDLIPFLQLHGKISVSEKLKWSIQLSSALLHLRETTHDFYPDLRLDNLVLTAERDIVMVDFEQRGVWCEFAAPEVNAIEYMRLLAIDEEIPDDVQEKYSAMLSTLLPEWKRLAAGEEYRWPCSGYNIPWACLQPVEQEACEVYMLGRVLWCIFEGKSAPQRAAAWLSYRWEPLVEFPEFTTTPEPIRDLIDRCTLGRKPSLSQLIVRDRNQLVLRHLEHMGKSSPEEVQETARKWWSDEIKSSEEWLAARSKGLKDGDWQGNYYNRPTLREVYSSLKDLEQSGVLG